MPGVAIKAADPAAGHVEAEFTATEAFLNFTGSVHGGILVAMLDDLMGYAPGITLPAGRFAATGNLNASFLRPAPGCTLSNSRPEASQRVKTCSLPCPPVPEFSRHRRGCFP